MYENGLNLSVYLPKHHKTAVEKNLGDHNSLTGKSGTSGKVYIPDGAEYYLTFINKSTKHRCLINDVTVDGEIVLTNFVLYPEQRYTLRGKQTAIGETNTFKFVRLTDRAATANVHKLHSIGEIATSFQWETDDSVEVEKLNQELRSLRKELDDFRKERNRIEKWPSPIPNHPWWPSPIPKHPWWPSIDPIWNLSNRTVYWGNDWETDYSNTLDTNQDVTTIDKISTSINTTTEGTPRGISQQTYDDNIPHDGYRQTQYHEPTDGQTVRGQKTKQSFETAPSFSCKEHVSEIVLTTFLSRWPDAPRTIYCDNCHYANSSQNNFCTHCGNNIEDLR